MHFLKKLKDLGYIFIVPFKIASQMFSFFRSSVLHLQNASLE